MAGGTSLVALPCGMQFFSWHRPHESGSVLQVQQDQELITTSGEQIAPVCAARWGPLAA